MKITWDRYHKYSDGSRSTSSGATVEIGDKTYYIHIEDHTLENAKKFDFEMNRSVPFAYLVPNVSNCFKEESFRKLGFRIFPMGGKVGIDENEGYMNETCECQFVGKPQHTIEEVEKLVELAIIDSFQFDYEKELAKAKEALDARKRIMDEANEYKQTLIAK